MLRVRSENREWCGVSGMKVRRRGRYRGKKKNKIEGRWVRRESGGRDEWVK